jgi:glycosyltransferase involved in cell wall biosynthesis
VSPPSCGKTVIASYCATFLPREMLHVYRQVRGVASFENHVITRSWRNAELFPYAPVHVISKSRWRALRRLIAPSRPGRIRPLSTHELEQIRSILDAQRASLLHAYLGTEAARLLPILGDLGIPVVVSFHGADVSSDLPQVDLEGLLRHSQRFLCRSESLRRALILRGVPAEHVSLNPTGVPIPAEPSRAVGAEGQGPLWVVQACRFVPKKGIETSLRAVRLLADRGVPVRFTLAGDGPLRRAVEESIASLGIQDYVRLTGFLAEAELAALYGRNAVYIQPSEVTATGDQEGIPNALLEAMAHGLAVVATRHGGIPEVVVQGDTGLLIESADVTGLADALAALRAEPAFARALGHRARAIVAQRHSVAASIRTLEAIYKAVLCNAPARG